MLPKNRSPTTPGEMLVEEFLKPQGLTQVVLAEQMGVPVQRVDALVAGKRGVTAEAAILLSRALGTTAELWMNTQAASDLWAAQKKPSG